MVQAMSPKKRCWGLAGPLDSEDPVKNPPLAAHLHCAPWQQDPSCECALLMPWLA